MSSPLRGKGGKGGFFALGSPAQGWLKARTGKGVKGEGGEGGRGKRKPPEDLSGGG